MMNSKVYFILALLALVWAIYLYVRRRKKVYLYITITFIATMLTEYPFDLPLETTLVIWSLLGIWIVFRDPSRKNPDSSLTMVGLMLIAFAIVFLSKTLLKMGVL